VASGIHPAIDLAANEGQQMSTTDIITDFVKALGTMSHSRAGWDYQLSPEQREKENRDEKAALATARAIWAANPDRHADLRAAFQAANPLATMTEIENHG
jgi:hypothetical protein